MTVTGYVDSTTEVSLAIPSMELTCVENNQQCSNGDTSRVKVIPPSNNQDYTDDRETESFDMNNDRDLSKSLVDGAKIKIVRSNNESKKGSVHKKLLKQTDELESLPPDGGARAWMIMLGSFFVNGIIFGTINSYSIIYTHLTNTLEKEGESGVGTKAALVGSLTIGTTFLMSPVVGIITDRIGIQRTTFVGGALACGGMLLSSMFPDQLGVLFLTYGIMYGLGASLAYTPSLAILGHYFKRHLGLVNGIVTAGSSVFTVILSFLLKYILDSYNLVVLLRCLAALTSVVMLCALLFKPIEEKEKAIKGTASKIQFQWKTVIDMSIWKRKRYVVWASAFPIALFGYFVTYVHIGQFVKEKYPSNSTVYPVICTGIASGIGRLVFGYIADIPGINRILLQQISFVGIGISTILLPLIPGNYLIFLAITFLIGIFDGCFISLLGPIAFDICGRQGATQAIGNLLGMCSIPLTSGPPVAAWLRYVTDSYTIPFFVAGIPPIVGALAMCLVRCVKDDSQNDNLSEYSIENGKCRNGIGRMSLDSFDQSISKGQEGRSTAKLEQLEKITALCKVKTLQNSTHTCYYDPYADCKINYFSCSNEHRRTSCRCITFSESAPLLLSGKSIDINLITLFN